MTVTAIVSRLFSARQGIKLFRIPSRPQPVRNSCDRGAEKLQYIAGNEI